MFVGVIEVIADKVSVEVGVTVFVGDVVNDIVELPLFDVELVGENETEALGLFVELVEADGLLDDDVDIVEVSVTVDDGV